MATAPGDRDRPPDPQDAGSDGIFTIHEDTSLITVSVSRVRILTELAGSRATGSEIARRLDLNKSTVHGYLQELVEEGLVERLAREDRLWVYYRLTEDGRTFVAGDRLAVEIDLRSML